MNTCLKKETAVCHLNLTARLLTANTDILVSV